MLYAPALDDKYEGTQFLVKKILKFTDYAGRNDLKQRQNRTPNPTNIYM